MLDPIGQIEGGHAEASISGLSRHELFAEEEEVFRLICEVADLLTLKDRLDEHNRDHPYVHKVAGG